MSIQHLELAYAALSAFSPRVSDWNEDNFIDWEVDAKNLVMLAAEFGAAFRALDDSHEWLKRAQRFDEITGPDSEYERSRQAVVSQLPAASQSSSNPTALVRRWGALTGEETSFAPFPMPVEANLMFAESLLLCHDAGPRRDAVLRWREELARVEKDAEREHLWGTFLIKICTASIDPSFDSYFGHEAMESLLLAFRPLHRVAVAIRSAARSLYRLKIEQAGRHAEPRSDDVPSARREGDEECDRDDANPADVLERGTRQNFEHRECPLVLGNADAGEIVVLGKKKVLPLKRFKVIQALAGEFPATLTKDQLAEKSDCTDAVNMLKAIAKSDDDWRQVIKLAGTTGGGYGLIPRRLC
jgi:hypothetical protein